MRFVKRPGPTLDYSSPAAEGERVRRAEEERREAIDRYNASALGERRPFASALLRLAVVVAVATIPRVDPAPGDRTAAGGAGGRRIRGLGGTALRLDAGHLDLPAVSLASLVAAGRGVNRPSPESLAA